MTKQQRTLDKMRLKMSNLTKNDALCVVQCKCKRMTYFSTEFCYHHCGKIVFSE